MYDIQKKTYIDKDETCRYELICITLHRWGKIYRYYRTFERVQRRKIYTGW